MLLVRPPAPAAMAPSPPGTVLRAPTPEDIQALGRTYFASYEPGIACATDNTPALALYEARLPVDLTLGEQFRGDCKHPPVAVNKK
jgi:hypothetical protein